MTRRAERGIRRFLMISGFVLSIGTACIAVTSPRVGAPHRPNHHEFSGSQPASETRHPKTAVDELAELRMSRRRGSPDSETTVSPAPVLPAPSLDGPLIVKLVGIIGFETGELSIAIFEVSAGHETSECRPGTEIGRTGMILKSIADRSVVIDHRGASIRVGLDAPKDGGADPVK